MIVRRRRWTYSFRAWIDERGSNEDSAHGRWCVCRSPMTHTHYEGVHMCEHLRLWDLNTTRGGRNIIRVIRRRWPFYLHVTLGPRHWTVLRVGRRTASAHHMP